jgi:tetratricopeptide (TPR) repeat protein
VQKDPNNPQNLINLADSYRQAGDAAKAAAAYDRTIAAAYKILETDAKNSGIIGILATAYAKKGDTARAGNLIRQARQIDPKDNDLMYREATVHVLAGQPEDALQSLKQALTSGYSVIEARTDPELRSLRARPEFDRILKSAGPPAAK